MKQIARLALLLTLIVTGSTASESAKKQPSSLPVPELRFTGTEAYEANGFDFVRYKYEIANRGKFKKELFAAAPDLPACGENPNSSRTWVDLYDGEGKKLYWFCALTGPDDLAHLWFALTRDKSPPAQVYVELTDRRTGAHNRSNLAPTAAHEK